MCKNNLAEQIDSRNGPFLIHFVNIIRIMASFILVMFTKFRRHHRKSASHRI